MIGIVHIFKGDYEGIKVLDEKKVNQITAFLFHSGRDDDPDRLISNSNRSFKGIEIGSQGFLFSDDDGSTPVSFMKQLIEKEPKYTNVISPYIGGAELNSSPTVSHCRYVINFQDLTLDQIDHYPHLREILKDKVLSDRQSRNSSITKVDWWKFRRPATDMRNAAQNLERVLACSQTSKFFSYAFLPKGTICSHKLVVFSLDKWSHFLVLQSRVHEIWAVFFGCSLEDRPVYTPSDCFDTFPFPFNWETNPTLEAIGKTYYEFRAGLMVRHNEGLTDIYNRFHDPDETNPDILKLRELHAQMDRAVLDAYGWTDIPTDCEFLLDYDDDDDEGTSKRKKPWRYRWPEEVHDEVLARLLKLNQERAEEEKLGGKSKRRKEPAKPVTTTSKLPLAEKQLDLIPPDKEQLDLF